MTYALALYTQPHCSASHNTRQALDKRGLKYVEINILDDPDTSKAVLDQYGLDRTPAIIAKTGGEIYRWQGYSENRIDEFISKIKDNT